MALKKIDLLKTPLILTLLSLLLGFFVGAVVLALVGYNPFTAYGVMFAGVFGSPKDLAFSIIHATPLIFTGLSVAFAFKTGLFNIGAEGQFIMGSLTAALLGAFVQAPWFMHIPLVLMGAIVIGSLWGSLAGYLKAKFGIHEVITTIMLNWIALYFNNFIVMIQGITRPQTQSTMFIQDSARIDLLGAWKTSAQGIEWRVLNPDAGDILGAPINFGILLAIITTVLIYILLTKSTLGFQLKAVGLNKDGARANGIGVKKATILSMGIAGALAALGGAITVMGVTRDAALLSVMEGNGFDGIAVALMGNSNPIGTFFSGLFFGALKQGGPQIQTDLGAPTEIVNIVMGIIIFFLAVPTVWTLLRRFLKGGK